MIHSPIIEPADPLTCPACGRESAVAGCANTPGCANYRAPVQAADDADHAYDHWEAMQEEEDQRQLRARMRRRENRRPWTN